MLHSFSRCPRPLEVVIEQPAIIPVKREQCSSEEVVNSDGILIKQTKPIIYDAVKALSVYRVSDFSIGSLLQAGVTDLSQVSLSRSAAEISDSVPCD